MGGTQRSRQVQLERYPLIGAVEGNQELLYFKHLKAILDRNDPSKTLVVQYEDVGGSSPLVVVQRAQRARSSGAQKISAVFDHDNKEDEFCKALHLCSRKHIWPSYSNMNFDLWLLLHKAPFTKPVNSTDEYKDYVRAAYQLDRHADIKSETIQRRILAQIDLSDVLHAIRRAEDIRLMKDACQKTARTTACGLDEPCYENPDLLIRQHVKNLICECLGRKRYNELRTAISV